MLHKLKQFLIRFTIPVLLNTKFLKKNLPKEDYLNLVTIVGMNNKLISGLSKNNNEFYLIRNYFLTRLEIVTSRTAAIKLLPTLLRDTASIPTLKSLTINYLRNRFKKQYMAHKIENRNNFLWKKVDSLTMDLKKELSDEFDGIFDKRVTPFGPSSSEEAYDLMMKIYELLELELNETEFSTEQILAAVKVALIGQTSAKNYITMLEDLTGHTEELLDVLSCAIRKNRLDVYYQLLEIKSDFKVIDHVRPLLSVALEYGNIEIYKALLKIANIPTLLETSYLLHSAAESGSPDMVNKFLELQFDPMKRNPKKWLAIHNAIKDGNLEIYNLLLPYVEKELTDEDNFNLFYLAAINGHLEIIQHLMKKAKLTVMNSDEQTLLELVNAKLNQRLDTEKKCWGLIYSSFDKLYRVIKFLQDHTPPQEIKKPFIRESTMTILHSQKAAEKNTRLIENVESIVNHPDIAVHISIYDRYLNGTNNKETIFIVLFILISLVVCTILILGGFKKAEANSNPVHVDSEMDHLGNVLLGIGGGLTLADAFLLMCICMPRNKIIPCTNFFRHNTPPAVRPNVSDEEMAQVIPLNNS